MSRGDYVTELKTARSQRRKLATIRAKITEMVSEWDGLSGPLETGTEQLLNALDEHIKALDEDIEYWRSGGDSGDE
ncbi:hypothetical protein ACQV2E_20935 [Pantoea allii]|uniref:Uncharacterized protein n=2 Tax=Pantoea TaxID=53335 RepID=A0AAJ1D238_PANAN|nr:MULTISPECIES: hypothetical protein [Pantoea]KHD99187.1 hypothetical protein NL54_22280 [Pantoea stewartii]KHN56866.1 hypothetical protein OI73_22300 [Pantoea stewartii]MBW1215790.1 hypothetical protein [Pantoea allii]MBW1254640.1 hypothetical protein [Pantoea allii]MBW1259467.1 hypothetical protein [Pantoea allii]